MEASMMVEEDGWGFLVVLEVGNSYKCIMHSEHVEGALQVVHGDIANYSFVDEQHVPWLITLNQDVLVFNSPYHNNEITVSAAEFKQRMGNDGEVDDVHPMTGTMAWRER